MAAPIAPSVPYSASFLQKTGKTAAELNTQKIIPDEEEVGVPAYPDSYFYQANTGIEDRLLSVVLVSHDTPEMVSTWYKENYSGSNKIKVIPFTYYEWMGQMMDIADMKSEIWISIK